MLTLPDTLPPPEPGLFDPRQTYAFSPDALHLAGPGTDNEQERTDTPSVREEPLEYGAVPAPFYASTDNRLRLFQGDALALLRRIPAETIDMVFADPPYFLSNGGVTCVNGRMVPVDKGQWDRSQGQVSDHSFNILWLDQCRRVLKANGTLWVTGTSHNIYSVGHALQTLGYKILNDIAWYKVNPPPNLACRRFTHATETILWAAKSDKSRYTFHYGLMKEQNGGKQMQSLWAIQPPGKNEKRHGKHPTQKPEALLTRIVQASTQADDLVLDPFCGSATTGVACTRLGRRFVGIEREAEHLTLAALRLQDEVEKLREQSALPLDVILPTKIGGGGVTIMEREEALALLNLLRGVDLVEVAGRHGQKIFHEKALEGEIRRTLNKGWAGLTLEAYLGLPPNSRQEPNGGSWELKQVSLVHQTRGGIVTAKETMQITMVNRAKVTAQTFEDSYLLHKIARLIVVARLYIDKEESSSPVAIVRPADVSLETATVYNQVRRDYELIRDFLKTDAPLQTVSGQLLQIRTKGQKGSATYAFYARKPFVNILLGINK